jgi:hypothetical protein
MALAGNVRRSSRNTSDELAGCARVNPDELADLERTPSRETEQGVRWFRWSQE